MAQTGYTPISIYYSSTAGNTPTAGNLVAGELAINTADGKLFYKDSAGVVQVIAGKGGAGVAGGSNTQVQYNSSGSLAGSANLIFDGTNLGVGGASAGARFQITGTTNASSRVDFVNNTSSLTASLGAANDGTAILKTVSSHPLVFGTVDTEAMRISTAQKVTITNDASISGLTVGKGGGSVASNTVVGLNALSNASTTGVYSVAIGSNALKAANTGDYNIAVGGFAMESNTSGTRNIAVGYASLDANTTGSYNVAVGHSALLSNTASYNSAAGYEALKANTTGANNTALGLQSLYSNTTASYNTAVGYQALYSTSTTGYLTALGYKAGYAKTSGDNYGSVFVGFNAGYQVSTGTDNTIIGSQAGQAITTAYNNTAVGGGALYSTTANGSTAIGYNAGLYATTGIQNTFIGNSAGNAITTGGKNVIIGSYSGNSGGINITTSSNNVVLSDGDGAVAAWRTSGDIWYFGTASAADSGAVYLAGKAASGSGPIIVGFTGTFGSLTSQWYTGSNSVIKGGTTYNTYTVTAGGTSGGVNLTSGSTSWASASDARLKNVTGKYETPLVDIAQLEPVKFTWKSDTENKPQVGVLAQSVEKVVPEAIDTMRVDKEDETDYLGVRYTELIPLMIASIQELKAEVDSLKQQLGK